MATLQKLVAKYNVLARSGGQDLIQSDPQRDERRGSQTSRGFFAVTAVKTL